MQTQSLVIASGNSGKVHLALSELPDFTALPGDGPHLRGTLQIAGDAPTYLEDAFRDYEVGRPSARPYMEITLPSTVDDSLCPEGHHVMSQAAIKNMFPAVGAKLSRTIRVLANTEEGALMVLGGVKTSAHEDGQLVEVHWSVINDEGQELGSVTQSNVVPLGTLDGSWGDLAHDVADGAADGVVTLLREAYRRRPALKSDWR